MTLSRAAPFQYLKYWCCHLSHSSCINLLAEMPGLQLSFGAISQMFLHSFLSARSVAQLVERLSCKQKTRVQVPAAPTLFEQGGLAHPCNPATWMLRSGSWRNECEHDWLCLELPLSSIWSTGAAIYPIHHVNMYNRWQHMYVPNLHIFMQKFQKSWKKIKILKKFKFLQN